ncbi:mitochondrial thiamine pyrophosphate carrier-like [Condylostylus longicornis]|uniref:mitochondrial thiamine pyrophosphate carrier-like n=1 Tax=Condylostylus longicornis TaxID=2530218 RepID=UPI00244DA397|nr:mitochondrial thiamine pyrophosphate carrier-like [Condylostylus longicornis]
MPVDIHDHMHDHIHVNENALVKKDDHRQMKQMFAGGLSAALTRTASQPLDVLKVRFQLQIEPVKETKTSTISKYRSISHAVSTIYKEEGFLALWKGHNPGQVLSIMFGIAQFWSFEQFKLIAKEQEYLKNSPNAVNFICGAFSGGIATFCAQPLDVLRTRLIAQDHGEGYRNSFHGMSNIIKTEGIRGLYRGINPSLIQIMPLMGTNFMVYKMLKDVIAKTLKIDPVEIPSLALMIIGGISGTVSKTIVYPFDLVKKRLQIQGFHKHRKTFGKNVEYNSILHCFRLTVAQEGFLGLFKGMTPTLLKSGWVTALNFCFYDKIIDILH